MNPENYPDKTLSEIEDSDEYEDFDVDDRDEFFDEVEEYRDAMEILASSIMLARMLKDDYITFREYIRLTNYVEDFEIENGTVL
jgi:hypothetical protein